VAGSHPLAVATTPGREVAADAQSQLSDGVIVETSVLARLLGVKLLTLEGVVVLSPAHLRDAAWGRDSIESAPRRPSSAETEALGASPRLARIDAQRQSSETGSPVGGRLDDAEQILAQCSTALRKLQA
jgi:hypothetical protein